MFRSFGEKSFWRFKLSVLGLLFSIYILSAQTAQPIGPYLNNVFPDKTPGAIGAWEVIDFLPDNIIPSPLKIIAFANIENKVLVLTKIGEVWELDLTDGSHRIILDIKDRSFKLGEAGSVGIALHPRFGETDDFDLLFLYYRTKPDPDEWSDKGFNRLSKFRWDPVNLEFDKDSEEVLIQQYDRSTWHNGGGLFFGDDGFLYLTIGDEGDAEQFDINKTTQIIDGGFFGGMFRIDIDNDTTKSHPIRRQPIHFGNPPAGWGDTYSQGYSIPNSNPWLDEDGKYLEEYFAIGLRSPYGAFYDSSAGDIWVTDAGTSVFEEINIAEKGSNHQWPYVEGDSVSIKYSKPDSLIGNEQIPLITYSRKFGSAVVGGGVYRGPKFSQLDGKYIFGDFTGNKVMSVDKNSIEPEVLINDIEAFGISLPEDFGISGVHVVNENLILITIISIPFPSEGKILALNNAEFIPDPPSKLSEINAFKSLTTREPVDGFIPYKVNAPLWSDRAIKYRWIALPNDGSFDTEEEKIHFNELSDWEFPNGTVFMKHFELPLNMDSSGQHVPLETRFLVMASDGNAYGLTYKWNDEGTEAYLQVGASKKNYDIFDNGSFVSQQTWEFPSRVDCATCHNSKANLVLGVNTHQLNKEVYYPGLNEEINQITFLNDLNVFDSDVTFPEKYIRAYHITESYVPLEYRIRSYLDANCGFCHRKNGSVNTTDMDLRYTQPLINQKVLNYKTQSLASLSEFIVVPGDHKSSELWKRDASIGENRMPPLASNIVDQVYIDSLAKWIDGLQFRPPDVGTFSVSPNPSDGFFRIDVSEDWLPNYDLFVYNLESKMVLSVNEIDQSLYIVNLSGMATGIYFVVIRKGEKQFSQKVILH